MVVDYFLNLGTVEGESADHKHKGEIDLQSWSFGATNAGSFSMGGGGGAGVLWVKPRGVGLVLRLKRIIT